jgi:hypothetical protein
LGHSLTDEENDCPHCGHFVSFWLELNVRIF